MCTVVSSIANGAKDEPREKKTVVEFINLVPGCVASTYVRGDDEQKPPRNNVNVSLGHDANNRWERRRDEQLPLSSCSRACVPVGCRRGVL